MAKQIIDPQAGTAAPIVREGAAHRVEHASRQERARQHGVKVESCWWHDEYSGSIDALVAAGLAPLEHFPGRPGNPKISATYSCGALARRGSNPAKDETYVHIVRRSAKRFAVIVGLPSHEQKRRRCKASEEAKAEREAEVLDRLDRASAEATVEEYRKFTSDLILMTWRSATENTAKSLQPFALESVDIERLRGVLREALSIIKTARVVPLRKRAAALDNAQSDQLFQAFMVGQGLRDFATNEEQQ